MAHRYSAIKPFYPLVLAVMGSSALAAWLTMCILASPFTVRGVALAVATFLSFFTILSNILVVAVLITFMTQGTRGFLARPRPATAVAIYIVVVGLVYNLYLRWLWHPTATQEVLDAVLHIVMPLGYVIFWWNYVEKGTLRWRNVWAWLIYPLAFAFYNGLCMAVVGGNDPYPFLDVKALGLVRVLGFASLLAGVFLILGLIFIALDRSPRWRHRSPARTDV